MLFNSIDFAIFLPIVFFLYWFVCNRDIKLQNFLIVIASYVFYGWWDWRFLSLIFFSTIVDFSVGLFLEKTDHRIKRKLLLFLSIFVNLGFLGFFKYYNFFLDSFISTFSFFGYQLSARSLNIVLPVGISFYTFQTLSYTIDVYRRKMKPTHNPIVFFAYVSFFPQLVAGPIERATNLLPQFLSRRKFIYSRAVDGMRQILWGFVKKLVIADNCAEFANMAFNGSENYNGMTLLVGSFFFAFQIYGDFSGYSDIAIGTARLFGFNLMQNFAFPYFSRNIGEFWRRWHISLSSWFRDYLYIPLGGSKGGTSQQLRNTIIIFVVSGFWHGANWTFIVWGLLNALYFIPLMLQGKNRKHTDVPAEESLLPSPKEFLAILTTFIFTLIAWIFFRAESLSHAFSIVGTIFSPSFVAMPELPRRSLVTVALIAGFLTVEWIGRKNQYAIEKIWLNRSKIFRWSMYASICLIIILYAHTSETPFIYFQF